MNVHHTLICFFFLSLHDGNTGLIRAEEHIISEKEGGYIRHACSFSFSGSRKMFCKGECKEKNILIETTGDRAQRGRYSIEYKEGTFPVSSTLLYVSITNLTKSDSGWYRCGLVRDWRPDGNDEFEIKVEDAPVTSIPNWTPRPFSASIPSASTLMTTTQKTSDAAPVTSKPNQPFSKPVPSASTLTTTQSLSSSSRSSPRSPETTKFQSEQQHRPADKNKHETTSGVLLYVGLTLVVMIIILSAAVLIFWRTRTSKPKEPFVETEYANVTEASRVYEEIREEDRQISTVYTCAKYSKPNAVETTDDYSFVTAVKSQGKTEDDSSKLTYSEVDFSNGAAASLNSAPCGGDTDNVIYSVPRAEATSDSSPAEEASPPLYSAITSPQL